MTATTLLQRGSISVYDYRCTAGPDSKPFVEQHRCHSIAYVRKGSFGCTKRGQSFELVAGSLLIGHPGDEYVCTHDHHVCGDECLSFSFSPALVDGIGGKAEVWQAGCAPPLSELMVLGELAQAEPVAAAMSGSMKSATRWRTVSSRCCRDGRKSPCGPWRATAAAPSKQHCGSMRIRTGRSTWKTRPIRQASVRFTSCGCFPTCSA
jgi:hypothetical protein